MSQRWRAIQHVSLSPTAIGDIVKSAAGWWSTLPVLRRGC
jgi:hypothetical protein